MYLCEACCTIDEEEGHPAPRRISIIADSIFSRKIVHRFHMPFNRNVSIPYMNQNKRAVVFAVVYSL